MKNKVKFYFPDKELIEHYFIYENELNINLGIIYKDEIEITRRLEIRNIEENICKSCKFGNNTDKLIEEIKTNHNEIYKKYLVKIIKYLFSIEEIDKSLKNDENLILLRKFKYNNEEYYIYNTKKNENLKYISSKKLFILEKNTSRWLDLSKFYIKLVNINSISILDLISNMDFSNIEAIKRFSQTYFLNNNVLYFNIAFNKIYSCILYKESENYYPININKKINSFLKVILKSLENDFTELEKKYKNIIKNESSLYCNFTKSYNRKLTNSCKLGKVLISNIKEKENSLKKYTNFDEKRLKILVKIISLNSFNQLNIKDHYIDKIKIKNYGIFIDSYCRIRLFFNLGFDSKNNFILYPLFLGNVSLDGVICWGKYFSKAMDEFYSFNKLIQIYTESIFSIEGDSPYILEKDLNNYLNSEFLDYNFNIKKYNFLKYCPYIYPKSIVEKLPIYKGYFLEKIELIYKESKIERIILTYFNRKNKNVFKLIKQISENKYSNI